MSFPRKKLFAGLLFLVLCVAIYVIVPHHSPLKPSPFIEMVYVKGGTFMMGASREMEYYARPKEYPAHKVTLSSYYIGKYPITCAQYARFVEETGYVTDAERGVKRLHFHDHPPVVDTGYGSWIYDGMRRLYEPYVNWRYDMHGRLRDSSTYNHPVVHLTWTDANAFCIWLSEKEGKQYRMPTEAEWEYAARGGRKSKGYIYSGSDNLDEVGWYLDNSDLTLHPVGQKKPNELGLYDMSGLILEYTSDGAKAFTEEPQTDPHVPIASYEDFRADTTRKQESVVGKGGNMSRPRGDARVSFRTYIYLNQRGGGGFRVVCREK